MAQPPALPAPADFGAQRTVMTATMGPGFFDFMNPHIGATTDADWQHGAIDDPETGREYLRYATCVAKGAMIIFGADFTYPQAPPEFNLPPPARHIDLRMWQAIAYVWVAAGGDLANLRYIAFHHVTNNYVLSAIQGEYARLGTPRGQTVTITPGDASWNLNSFARCGSRLAQHIRAARPPGTPAENLRAHMRRPFPNDPNPQAVWQHFIVEIPGPPAATNGANQNAAQGNPDPGDDADGNDDDDNQDDQQGGGHGAAQGGGTDNRPQELHLNFRSLRASSGNQSGGTGSGHRGVHKRSTRPRFYTRRSWITAAGMRRMDLVFDDCLIGIETNIEGFSLSMTR